MELNTINGNFFYIRFDEKRGWRKRVEGQAAKGGHEKGSSAESDKFTKNNEIIGKDLQQGAERKLSNSNRRTSRR